MSAGAAIAGPPFVTDNAGTLDAGHFEIDLAAAYTSYKGGASGTVPSIQVNYGPTDNLELSVLAPLAFAQASGVGTNFGIGDTLVGLKYRFIDADDEGWRPGVAFAPSVAMPSGSAARGLGGGQVQASLPVWISKSFGEWTVFGGSSYNVNPGFNRRDWWFSGIGLTKDLSATWTIGGEVYHTTPVARGLHDSTGFNVGVIYNINDVHHLTMSLGRNIANAAENNTFSVYIGYEITF